jgi:ATP-binding protein involved in chromosome partitioning
MPFPCQGELEQISHSLTVQLSCVIKFIIKLEVKEVRQISLNGAKNNVKNIIAISSGKGGVGKSTTTVNLAYALIAEGAKVGILDADIYGPSIPRMLGLKNEKPSSSDGKLMDPVIAHGLSAISIGFLVEEKEATVWRGPMASSAFNQLIQETAWPKLDYLLIDMPPGTGDIQLTLAQKVPVSAAVIITTPQDIALVDAKKGVSMFTKVKVPVLGVIENMSYHLCENCGHQSHIFGEQGGINLANSHKTPLLGQLPLDITIRENADKGVCELINDPNSNNSQRYREAARQMVAQLFNQIKANKEPEIIKVINVE